MFKRLIQKLSNERVSHSVDNLHQNKKNEPIQINETVKTDVNKKPFDFKPSENKITEDSVISTSKANKIRDISSKLKQSKKKKKLSNSKKIIELW